MTPDVRPPTSVRVARPSEFDRLSRAYRALGYKAGIAPMDVVYVAEQGADVVGLVRRTNENEVTMLRGMHVAPANQRQGVGSLLLAALVADLDSADCYCIPFAHLPAFYGRYGFETVTGNDIPASLASRVAVYREEGHDVIVMLRRAAARQEG